ncbi:hypothetical protein [Spirosoma telluris]
MSAQPLGKLTRLAASFLYTSASSVAEVELLFRWHPPVLTEKEAHQHCKD